VRRRPISRVTALLALVTALPATGCGRERIDPPDVTRPATPARAVEQQHPDHGLTFTRPGNWPFEPGSAPLVASTASGNATIAIWRYLRSEPLPREDEELAEAQQNLERAARSRDATFELERSRRTRVDGAPALELVGDSTVTGQRRRVRSTHVYAKGAEVVIDAYAAPDDFARVDEAVFRPLLDSFKIDPPAP
jgi:hypothetical protein